MSVQAKVKYGSLSSAIPSRERKGQSSRWYSSLEVLQLIQSGMALSVASHISSDSYSQVAFPSSVLQLFSFASIYPSSSRHMEKETTC